MKRFWPLAIAILVAGCATEIVPATSYYVLEYYPELENKRLIRDEPFPYNVHVLDTRIPRTYSRKQIVIRDAGPRFNYSATDVWGGDLSDTIPNLVAARLQRYRMFRSVRREYIGEGSDLDVETSVRALELVRTGTRGQARLEMEFSLASRGSVVSPVQHRVARQEKLADVSVETFVIRINDMILEETDAFVAKVVRYLESGETSEAYPTPDEGRLEPFAGDVQGFGVILMPSLSGTDQEPFYQIYGADGVEVSSAKMGVPVVVPEGRYRITYGSGRETQLMEMRDVRVVPRYKRVVEPDWGALTVSIVTEAREWVKMSYELFDGQSGESYGTDISADETRGEQGRVWVLRPGTYKITINGEPFTTYRDFTTATLVVGETRRITVVVGTDPQGTPTNLLGAGVLEEEGPGGADRPVRINATLSGTVDFSSDNRQIPDDYAVTTTVAGELGARLVVDQEPLLYTLRTVVEAGFEKSRDTEYRVSPNDAVILKNTLIYFFLKNLGLYGRFDLDTHLFPQRTYPGSTSVQKQDSDGNPVPGWPRTVEDWEVEPSLFPLVLREGLGLNYRLVNLSRADLNLRTGLGLKQEFNDGVYAYQEGTSGPEVWREQKSTHKTGIEVSAVGSFSLPYGLTYTSSADLLFPFEQDTPVSLEWENILDLRLLRYLSLEYTFVVKNRYEESPPYTFWDSRNYILDHRLVLRAIYVIR